MWRKVRGALGIATAWAAAWGIWGAIRVGATLLLGVGYPLPIWPILGASVAQSAVSGFLAGGLFSAVLTTRFGQRTLHDLDPGRLAWWGALVALPIPLAVTALVVGTMGLGVSWAYLLPGIALHAIPGLVTAYATIRIAQSADRSLGAGVDSSRLATGD